jgi:hypothetical protein
MTEKTLAVWMKLDGLNQINGVPVETISTDNLIFDGMDFAVRTERIWIPRSNGWDRTLEIVDAYEENSRQGTGATDVERLESVQGRFALHMAVVYNENVSSCVALGADTPNKLTMFRNGELYGQPYCIGELPEFGTGLWKVNMGKSVQGEIHDVKIWDKALTPSQVKRVFRVGYTRGGDERAYGFLAPFHNNDDYHGRAVRVNLDGFTEFKELDFVATGVQQVVDVNPMLPQKQRSCTKPDFYEEIEGPCSLAGFAGGFVDYFGWAYFVPRRTYGGFRHGKVVRVRYDNFSHIEWLDLATAPTILADTATTGILGPPVSSRKGFAFGFTAGRHAFFLPFFNGAIYSGEIARVDSTDFTKVETLDLMLLDKNYVGYSSGFTSGSHGYLVPADSRIGVHGNVNTKLIRFNLASFADVESLDLNATFNKAPNPTTVPYVGELGGYSGGFSTNQWAYLVPNKNRYGHTGLITRVMVKDFATIQFVDLGAMDPALVGFNGGFAYKNNIFFVPYKNNKLAFNSEYHGKFVRIRESKFQDIYRKQTGQGGWSPYDLSLSGEGGCTIDYPLTCPEPSTAAVTVLDLTLVDPRLRGYISGYVAWGVGYLTPQFMGGLEGYSGLVVGVDLEYFDTQSVFVLKLSDYDPKLIGFFGGTCEVCIRLMLAECV